MLSNSVRRAPANRGRIVVAKVGLDGHDRGARVLARLLREEGFEVVYVGIRHTPEQVADIVLSEQADVVALSILSGAHVSLAAGVRRALDARGFKHVPIAVGGLIPQSDAQALKDAGVARAFHPGDGGIGADIITGAMDELIGKSRIPITLGD
jgi:methylmalonyl-CoA mutase, C-terminal domain